MESVFNFTEQNYDNPKLKSIIRRDILKQRANLKQLCIQSRFSVSPTYFKRFQKGEKFLSSLPPARKCIARQNLGPLGVVVVVF